MPKYKVTAKVANSKHRTIESAEVTAPNRIAADRMFRAAQPTGSRVTRVEVKPLDVPKPPAEKKADKAKTSRTK